MRPPECVNPVVVGIDGSAAAINAARWAVDEAVSRGVPLRLVHVCDQTPGGSVESDSSAAHCAKTTLYAARCAVRSSGKTVDVQATARRGDIDRILVEESRQAAMICVGSVGIGRAISRLFGSSAVALANHSHCPVAIIRTNSELPQQNRVVAVVDRYPDGDDVIHHALDEARLRGASLLALGVRRWKVGALSGLELNRRLERWLPSYPDVEVRKCITDSAAEYLVTRDEQVQLVVTGSADADNLTRFVGPHGHALATYPRCSVLLVRCDDAS